MAALLAVSVSGGARAATFGTLLPAGLSGLDFEASSDCAGSKASDAASIAGASSFGASKSAAILGGQPSRLELIASQQSGIRASLPRPSTLRVAPLTPPQAAGGQPTCPALVANPLAKPAISAGLQQAVLGSGDFLGSRRVAVGRSPFDRDWARIRRERLDRSWAGGLAGTHDGNPTYATLVAVNAWTNDRIRYVEDEKLYGRADYWAGARRTLRARAGDCEDIAIVKMQLLAAMGVNRSDMYLTIARDLARNADHAVLVVKMGDRNWLLDNSTPQVLDAALNYDYRPILSFAADRKWLHGY